jgi:DNA-directed RNA polymerase sigma subunit (sigma70/sigma32)
MPKKRTQKFYFGEAQEEAVIRYLKSESGEEKNKIFNEYLREPLTIMVESIIRRYKLYRKGITFEDTHTDTVSFLMTKINKFDSEQNYKAYSYFGTICKNYLMGAIQKDTKDINRTVSYEDISSDIEEHPDMIYVMDEVIIDYKDVIQKLILDLEVFVVTETLTENEEKLAFALLDIFYNFDKIFQVGDGNKFNKNLILLSLREMTSLNTKEIRISLKKFKKLYDGVLSNFINY